MTQKGASVSTPTAYHIPQENASLHNGELRKQAAALASVLHRGGAWGMFWTPNGNGGAKKLSHYVPTAKDFTPPAAWLRSANLYFGVHPLAVTRKPWQASRNGDVAAINALFAEFDAVDFLTDDEIDEFMPLDPEGGEEERDKARDDAYRADPDAYKARALAHVKALPVRPSACWDSGGGYQCVWLLAETILIDDDNRDDIADLQKRWVAFVRADAGAADLRRVLRWPGGRNRKPRYAPAYPLVAFTWCDIGKRYDVDELRGMLPAETAPHIARRTAGPPDDAAVAESMKLVDAVLAHGDMTHGGWQVWDGGGRRAILDACPFMPENDPHGRDGAAGVFVYADGRIGATCHHNRCKHEIEVHGGSGWQWLREIAGMPKRDAALSDEEIAALDAFDVWLTTPGAFDEARAAGFRNPDRGKRLLDALAEMTRNANRMELRPGYAALALASGVSKPQIGGYLARWYAAGRIEITPGTDGAPTAIKLVFHNRNSTSPKAGNTVPVEENWRKHRDDDGAGGGVPVVKNWNLYRVYRGDEAFLQGHHVYNVTRPNATLPALGGALNALPVLASMPDVTARELAAQTGARYGTAARWLRLLAEHALVDVTVGARNSKVYALRADWCEVLDANREHMPTYAVVLDRRRQYKRDAVIQAKLHRPDRVDRLQADLDRLSSLWRSAVARAGIVPYHRPDSKRERLDRLRVRGERRERQLGPPDPLRLSQLAASAHEARKSATSAADFRRMMHYAGYSDGDIAQYARYEELAATA